MTVVLYHRTTAESAQSILRDGFRDGSGNYVTESLYSGVWLSNLPLDANEGACDGVLLEVQLNMTEEELAQYEWVEEGKPYREWLIPAAVLNPRATVRIAES